MLQAKYEKLKKEFERLSSIHSNCRSQKEKKEQIYDKVTYSYIAVYESI